MESSLSWMPSEKTWLTKGEEGTFTQTMGGGEQEAERGGIFSRIWNGRASVGNQDRRRKRRRRSSCCYFFSLLLSNS
jgi:hypothetical protein